MNRKHFSLLALFAFFTLALVSCSKDDDNMPKVTYNLSATANGGQEVPAVTTNASGTLTGSYNINTKMLTYTINWNGLSGAPTGMHFHGPASAGANAGVALAIAGFPASASGSYSGSATLTDAQQADLLAGKWYWNVHTAANAGGEIRGQVSAQ